MNEITMEQDALQSYFESLCNSFYIAYTQVKRLERERKELYNSTPSESELDMVKSLLKMYEDEEFKQMYLMEKYSKEELEARKRELELGLQKYEDESKKLEEPLRFWSDRMNKVADEIERTILSIKRREFIITRKEEIFALMAFFRKHTVSEHQIVNTQAVYLQSFPTGEMSEEFLEAYLAEDGEKMYNVIKKYF